MVSSIGQLRPGLGCAIWRFGWFIQHRNIGRDDELFMRAPDDLKILPL